MAEDETILSNFGIRVSKNKAKLTKYGVTAFLGYSILPPIILGIVIFLSAGHTDIPRAWIFLFAMLVIGTISTVLQYRINPELLNHRGEWKKKEGTKSWDRIIMPLYGIFHFYVQSIVIGLDVGRFNWSELGMEWMVIGIILYLVSAVILSWSMLSNPFFEATVRIQKERHQKIISTGPYSYVRHPGYLGVILWCLVPSLIAGSLYGLVPGAIAIAIILLRTHLEDMTLQKELDGYKSYAKKVKYRLIPGIW